MSNDDGLPNKIRLAFGARPDVRLFRNNVGVLQDREGRYVAYGLCVGSSDVIGFRTRIITAADVGLSFAQFLALECKKKRGKRTTEQKNFVKMVNEMGGIAAFVESVEDAGDILI